MFAEGLSRLGDIENFLERVFGRGVVVDGGLQHHQENEGRREGADDIRNGWHDLLLRLAHEAATMAHAVDGRDKRRAGSEEET